MGRTALYVFSAVAATLLALGCGAEDVVTAPTPVANIVDVEMRDNLFIPPALTINAGTSVRWTNNGSLDHTSTSGAACISNGVWNSATVAPGGNFTFAFTNTGTFSYFCDFHCASDNMVGNIVIQ